MPWVSKQQAKWGHSRSGVKALGAAGVRKWDKATPKGSLKRKYVGSRSGTMKLSSLAHARKGGHS